MSFSTPRWHPMGLWLLATAVGCTNTVGIGGPGDPTFDDLDEDGVFSDEDCDDLDPLRFPGNIEICDGRDSDCDGTLDGIAPTVEAPIPILACEREVTFNQDLRLDLLFVIDDSASMYTVQNRVADGVGDLLQWVVGPGLDTHIGVVNTDIQYSGGAGRLIPSGDVDYAHGGLDQPLDAWAADALVLGTGGGNFERPLDVILAATEPQTNPGFLRPDAHLSVMLLTDEDDQSLVSGAAFLESFRERLGPRGGSVHGLIPDVASGCVTDAPLLVSIVQATGGLRESICNADFAPFLSAVGQTSSQDALKTRYALPEPAQLGSVAVQVTYPGGLSEPIDPEDFALADAGRTLVLVGDPPPVGSRLRVRWLAQPED